MKNADHLYTLKSSVTVIDLCVGVKERTRHRITSWLSAVLVLWSLKSEVNQGVKWGTFSGSLVWDDPDPHKALCPEDLWTAGLCALCASVCLCSVTVTLKTWSMHRSSVALLLFCSFLGLLSIYWTSESNGDLSVCVILTKWSWQSWIQKKFPVLRWNTPCAGQKHEGPEGEGDR